MSDDLSSSSEKWVGKLQSYLASDEPPIKKMKFVHKYSSLFADAVMRGMKDTDGHQ